MATGELLVDAKGLTKRYGETTAAEDVSLQVYSGEVVGIVGPNGAGKTTTMEMMEGLRRPDAGSCAVCGYDSLRQNHLVREHIGLSLQQANMPKEVKVIELLRLYESVYRDPLPVGDLLHQFHLKDKAQAMIGRLSGGQRQRLILALAIIGRPRVIFLDEPTTGLDPKARRDLWDIIVGLRDEGRAIILSTHYMEEVERLCDRVVVMDRGRIVAHGPPEELIAAHGPESVIEVELPEDTFDAVTLSRLPAVTGIQVAEHRVLLHTSDTASSLMAFAAHVRDRGMQLGNLRTRSATMDDVFIALTGRSGNE